MENYSVKSRLILIYILKLTNQNNVREKKANKQQ